MSRSSYKLRASEALICSAVMVVTAAGTSRGLVSVRVAVETTSIFISSSIERLVRSAVLSSANAGGFKYVIAAKKTRRMHVFKQLFFVFIKGSPNTLTDTDLNADLHR